MDRSLLRIMLRLMYGFVCHGSAVGADESFALQAAFVVPSSTEAFVERAIVSNQAYRCTVTRGETLYVIIAGYLRLG